MPDLIQCRDGKMSPAVFICKHLLDPGTTEFASIPEEGKEMHVYMCGDCYRRGPKRFMKNVRLVCLHCLQERLQTMTRVEGNTDE